VGCCEFLNADEVQGLQRSDTGDTALPWCGVLDVPGTYSSFRTDCINFKYRGYTESTTSRVCFTFIVTDNGQKSRSYSYVCIKGVIRSPAKEDMQNARYVHQMLCRRSSLFALVSL
jgi:hypothetical protein